MCHILKLFLNPNEYLEMKFKNISTLLFVLLKLTKSFLLIMAGVVKSFILH